MNLKKVPAASLNPAAYNPRIDLKPGDAEYEKLKRSIEEFGDVQPIIWNERTGNIVGGHQRFKVLQDLGYTEIDCVVVDLDDQKEKALNIALNKIQGDWDETKLAAIMADFDAAAFDVSLTGFDAPEVDALLNKFYSHEAQEDNFDAETEKKKIEENGGPVSRPGDKWRLGEHVLVCGDPVEAETFDRLLDGDHAQMCFTQPPVNEKEYAKEGLTPWLARMGAVVRSLARYADIICWQTQDLMKTGDQYIEPMAVQATSLFGAAGLRPIWIRMWKMTGNLPTAGALQNSSNKPVMSYNYMEAFTGQDTDTYNDQEYTWISAFAAHAAQFVKRLTKDERRKWGYAGVWELSATRKGDMILLPVELPWRCIKMHSDVHGIVIDPFAGLGSTLMACEQSGRSCRAIA